MITVQVTSEKKLDTAEDIVAFLKESYADSVARAPFQPGDVVDIVNRSGMVPDMGVGDVAVVVYADSTPAPFSTIRCLHANGSTINIQVMTSNLAKRAVS